MDRMKILLMQLFLFLIFLSCSFVSVPEDSNRQYSYAEIEQVSYLLHNTFIYSRVTDGHDGIRAETFKINLENLNSLKGKKTIPPWTYSCRIVSEKRYEKLCRRLDQKGFGDLRKHYRIADELPEDKIWTHVDGTSHCNPWYIGYSVSDSDSGTSELYHRWTRVSYECADMEGEPRHYESQEISRVIEIGKILNEFFYEQTHYINLVYGHAAGGKKTPTCSKRQDMSYFLNVVKQLKSSIQDEWFQSRFAGILEGSDRLDNKLSCPYAGIISLNTSYYDTIIYNRATVIDGQIKAESFKIDIENINAIKERKTIPRWSYSCKIVSKERYGYLCNRLKKKGFNELSKKYRISDKLPEDTVWMHTTGASRCNPWYIGYSERGLDSESSRMPYKWTRISYECAGLEGEPLSLKSPDIVRVSDIAGIIDSFFYEQTHYMDLMHEYVRDEKKPSECGKRPDIKYFLNALKELKDSIQDEWLQSRLSTISGDEDYHGSIR